ncbi:hypothetical protein R6242_07690 [Iodobacter sp. CM08]|uniref:DUF7079 family protein n=1 Tax=Iodobacter sp. CM08 TaxID=3085902 RepID=UPI002982270B|nr:hypothetical protein [Iodobacter sp. CM08]MDW5416454.1 hypothetical protein [Iodobacter sp. CM08]
MNLQQRLDVWEALSDVYVDTETDFPIIAKKVKEVDLETLEYIFFDEVSAYCAVNFSSPIPPIWTGFQRENLQEGILAIIKENQTSEWKRFKHQVYVAYLRWKYQELWRELRRHVEAA